MIRKDSVVVIVDTDKEAQTLISNFFKRKNIRVVCFDNPQEAIYNLDPSVFKFKIGLLITDLYLPDIMTGKELSDTLKSNYPNLQSVIIVNRPSDMDLNSVSKNTGYLFMRPEDITLRIKELTAA